MKKEKVYPKKIIILIISVLFLIVGCSDKKEDGRGKSVIDKKVF